MGLKHLLLLLLTALLVEVSLQSAVASGAGVALRKAVKREDGKICGEEFLGYVHFVCGGSDWKKRSLQVKKNPPFPDSLYADDAGQKRTDPVGMADRIGSSFPHVKRLRRKRQSLQAMADKCCYIGCTYREIRQGLCSG